MKLLESKLTAWVAMALVVAMVVLTFLLHTPWYGFIAVFFCFVAVFAHLSALYLKKMSVTASRKLDVCALMCLLFAVAAFLAEYIIFHVIAE